MTKWKCEICGNEFENFHAQGFDNKIYCPLCYFKKLSADLQVDNENLKKQLEEWEHHLKCSKEMLDIQGQKGNYDYDEYMLGLYNGMEYIIALFETKEPNYISGKDVEFKNNKTQQKEFIEYLENEINKIKEQIKNYDIWHEVGTDINFLILKKQFNIEILSKYKEIIGDDIE